MKRDEFGVLGDGWSFGWAVMEYLHIRQRGMWDIPMYISSSRAGIRKLSAATARKCSGVVGKPEELTWRASSVGSAKIGLEMAYSRFKGMLGASWNFVLLRVFWMKISWVCWWRDVKTLRLGYI